MRSLPLSLAALLLLAAAAPHATANVDPVCYGTRFDLRAQHPNVEVCPPLQP